MTSRRARGDAGQVGGIEAIPFGLLVFVAGALLITNAWAVVDARFATDAAAHEGARAFVEALDASTASSAAVAAGLAAIVGHGRDPEAAEITTTGRLARCERITVTARYRVPAITIPFVGGFGSGFEVGSTAGELVDPYRADVPGSADRCG